MRFLSFLLLGLLPLLAAEEPACSSFVKHPIYPRIATTTHITGVVTANAVIGSDGRATATADGPATLLATSINALDRTTFPPRCQGTLNVVFHFVLEGTPDDTYASVTFAPPNIFTVKSPIPPVTCECAYRVPRRPWLRQFFGVLL